MLYDHSADVVRKALRGLALAPALAATRAGLPEKEVLAASRTPAPGSSLRALATALELGPQALAGLDSYRPPGLDLPGVTRLELPFDDETVNAWLIETGGPPLLCDTGDGELDAKRWLETAGIDGVEVLITHGHGDHTGGLIGLGGIARRVRGPAGTTPGIILPSQDFTIGNLAIRVIALPGHCDGAVGYVIEGLARPVCVTGDALFAGSMGGCAPGDPYRSALAALHAAVMTLPDETVILPGHGPATTVGSERSANPFLTGGRK